MQLVYLSPCLGAPPYYSEKCSRFRYDGCLSSVAMSRITDYLIDEFTELKPGLPCSGNFGGFDVMTVCDWKLTLFSLGRCLSSQQAEDSNGICKPIPRTESEHLEVLDGQGYLRQPLWVPTLATCQMYKRPQIQWSFSVVSSVPTWPVEHVGRCCLVWSEFSAVEYTTVPQFLTYSRGDVGSVQQLR